jgi:uncharacterized protein with FMN-binding domain
MASRSSRPKQKKAGVPIASASRGRKGKLSGSIIAISSAAIVAVYTLGRSNTSAVSDQPLVDAPTAVASVVPSAQTAGAAGAAPTVTPSTSRSQPTPSPTTTYKDGTYTGSGNSRHGGMQVTVVIKDGKITSANVTSCSTRYPCSDIDRLISAAVSKQSVPTNHVSGATDSSQAYRQALTNALKQAKA